ncbi:MAG: HIT domain-containing protein [Ignavibacteriae bacterium]|nr:MAG: HIT domain-containing protein [Ignavibacteriota bacterium]
MKHLFSPWRSEYIKTFSDEKKARSCLFCRMQREARDAENLIVWRGKFCFVVMNRYPYNSGHVMIVPYRHTSRFGKFTGEEHAEIMKLTAKCIEALEHISKPEGFNYGANLGRTAGAGIDKHIHFHLVPRWNGDTNFMPAIGQTKVVSEDIRRTWKKLKSEFKKLK